MIISLSPSAPENLVSRDGFGRLVPRFGLLILHTQAESDALLAGFLPIIILLALLKSIGALCSSSGNVTLAVLQ